MGGDEFFVPKKQLIAKNGRRRMLKNKYQENYLKKKFADCPLWTEAEILKIADETGLKPSQVYKWNWD